MAVDSGMFDVAIIGAGLAGLRAAYELRDFRVIIFEKETRAGGRVLTDIRDSVFFDLGAVLPYRREAAPPDFTPSPLRREQGEIGLFTNDQLHIGTSPAECLARAGFGPELIDRVRMGDLHGIPKPLYNAVTAFFHTIHAGVIEDYLRCRIGDAFAKYSTGFRPRGNGELVEAYECRLRATFLRKTRAVSVEERNGLVHIRYCEDGRPGAALSRAAIIATPGLEARKLLREVRPHCRTFLDSLRYGEATVVAVAVRGTDLQSCAYVVTPDLDSSTVLTRSMEDGHGWLFHIYFMGAKSAALAAANETTITARALEILRRLRMWNGTERDIVFRVTQRWPTVGVVISSESYHQWDARARRPSQRVFLAGDYVHVEDGDMLPYGVDAAIASGQKVGCEVRAFLSEQGARGVFGPEPLTDVSVYEISGNQPRFYRSRPEGTIAFYGLILQAEPDRQVIDYLMSNSVDFLWEYQRGFGITPEDSCLVMEGLLAAGVQPTALESSAQRLVELFFSSRHGAFQSLSEHPSEYPMLARGRAYYWHGPSLDATAHAGYLIFRIAPETYRSEIDMSAEAIARWQEAEGCWRSRWYPSQYVSTYYCSRFLFTQGLKYGRNVERAVAWIMDHQQDDGSWENSIISTAAAILTLRRVNTGSKACSLGIDWLRCRQQSDRWNGEPVLYYWFEFSDGRRLFHHCQDRGKITTAWAALALKTNEGDIHKHDFRCGDDQ